MRKLMTALALGMAVTGGSVVSAEEAQGTFTVTVHVTDNAGVSPKELANAQAHATAAYRAAGFDAVWSSAPWRPVPGSEATTSGSTEVRVVIVARDGAEKMCREDALAADVMGMAISEATAPQGRIAYIYYDRIERAAVQPGSNHVGLEYALGHVMAHEIGHLLIGVHSHSDQGLMRPEWNPRDHSLRTFTPSQAQTIRRRFTVTSAD